MKPSSRVGLKSFISSSCAVLLAAGGVLTSATSANAITVDNANQPIAFANASTIGANAAVGFTHRYENAVTIGSQVIDVIFSIPSMTSGASVNPSDQSGAPSGATNEMINSSVDFAGTTDLITYRLEFVEDGTVTPITLQNVAINVGDIDIQQFAQFAGITDYRLSSASTSPSSTASVLTPQTNTGSIPAGSYRFQSTSSQSTAADEQNWVEVRYAQVNVIEIVLGATVSGGAYFSIDFKPASWPVPANITTPAPTSYSVTYDSNTGDSGAAPGATSGTGSQTVLGNTGSLVKSGYTFSGWNTLANGLGTTYSAGSTIIPIGNVTLYALWVPAQTFTLSYDPNAAASGSAPSGTSGSGSVSLAPSAGTLSKPGFTFAGWNTAANGTGTTYQPGAALNLTSNITLYAMWTPVVTSPAAAPLLAETGPSEIDLVLSLSIAILFLSCGLASVATSRRLTR